MFNSKDSYSINDLLEIVKLLRSPDGCPWDRKQTHKSIRRNFIEETYEAIEAIDNDDSKLLREELGDVLLQILLHSEMEREQGNFDFSDVCNDLCKKLVFRHPHVFGDKSANTDDEALMNWEEMKKKEKNQNTVTETLTQVSKTLPALIYSEKVQKRAAKIGFDYESEKQAFEHLKLELDELSDAIEKNDSMNINEEFGDTLFSLVNVSRFLKIDAEQSLCDSTAKFIGRVSEMESLATMRGIDFSKASLNTLNSLWEEVKNTQSQQIFGGIINDKS